MVFTQREKIILAATIAVLCVLALDVYVLTPLLDEHSALEARRGHLTTRMARAGSVLNRRRLLQQKWRAMVAGGLKRDPAEAESQLLRLLRDWSSDSGLRLAALRLERSTEKTELPEITVHASGTGSMSAVSRLLWRIEKSKAPVKISMVQLGSRKDGTDDLSLHVKVSTLYWPTAQAAPAKATGRLTGKGRTGGARGVR
jgi:hypothetical protein